MINERYESLMRDAARTYNPPPDDVSFDEMWTSIRVRVQDEIEGETRSVPALREARSVPYERENAILSRAPGSRVVSMGSPGPVRRWRPWAQAAAALILGALLGRASSLVAPVGAPLEAPRAAASGGARAYDYGRSVTDEYLGEAAALLIALPAALESQRVDPSFAWRASDLLVQTRLLLDSPELSDPALRALFEDLEVVLVQVVRLGDWDPMKVDLLEQSLERQNVIPRLRSVVVEHFAD